MPRPKTPPPDNRRCKHKWKSGPRKGERCSISKLKGDDYCQAHSPSYRKQQQKNRSKGGKNAHKPLRVVDPASAKLAFKKSLDVIGALEDVFDEVRKGVLDHRVGQTLGMLGATMLKGLQYKESDDQDARIASLEKLLERMKRHAANTNGQAAKAGQAGASPAPQRVGDDTEEDVPGWLPDDEVGGDDSGPLAGEDAADPLWGPDID